MRKLSFGFFDNSGLPNSTRILIFYSFENEDRLPRSGILHYLIPERRFVGPRYDLELTSAALAFINDSGRLPPIAPAGEASKSADTPAAPRVEP